MHARPSSVAAAAAAALLAGACSTEPVNTLPDDARLAVVNARASSVWVMLDGEARALVTEGSALTFALAGGTYTVELRPSGGGIAFTRSLTVSDSGRYVVVAVDSNGSLPVILGDTNATVPSGATKLRVAHMAAGAPAIDIWRTQPDYQTPIRVQFPFNYRDVSPYLQSTPGAWRVLVSSAVAGPGDPMSDTLASTSPIDIADGRSRTVVVVDKPGGGLQLVVVDP